MPTSFDALPVFVRVAERESFTTAATELNVSKSHVSKTIRALEDRLGVRLFNRTTRKVTLTYAGFEYFEHCRRVLNELEEAERAVSVHQTTPVGILRMSVPSTLGTRYLASALSDFLAAHPTLELDMELSDRRVDLVDEGFDLAVRVGELSESSLVARKLAPTERYLVAAPRYLEQRGVPASPHELEKHTCLAYGYQANGPTWRLTRGSEQALVRPKGPVTTNNGEILREMAIGGHGIALLPDFIAHEQIRAGALVPLLEDWCGWNAAVWAVFPHRRHLSTRVRLFVDFLVARFSPAPPWCLNPRATADGAQAAAEPLLDESEPDADR